MTRIWLILADKIRVICVLFPPGGTGAIHPEVKRGLRGVGDRVDN